MKKALKGKTSKYGDLKKPYLIALNTYDMHIDRIDIIECLFGTEAFFYSTLSDPKSKTVIVPNGMWINKSGPINTRSSGILLGMDITPYNFKESFISLFYNPWAKYKYKGSL